MAISREGVSDGKRGRGRGGALGAIALALLGLGACCCASAFGALGYLGYAAKRFAEPGTLNSDAPTWDPGDVAGDFRVVAAAPLPPSARQCHYQYAAGIDHHGILRCDMSAEDFEATAAAAGMTPWAEDRTFTDDPMWLSFDGPGPLGTRPAWWSPPTDLGPDVRVWQSGSVWRFARHDGRTMWLVYISHLSSSRRLRGVVVQSIVPPSPYGSSGPGWVWYHCESFDRGDSKCQ